MRRRYVLIFIFTPDLKKVLLIKRKKPPYQGCFNGVGGKIELNESPEHAAYRECAEETGFTALQLDYLCTISYPEGSFNSNMEMSVYYGFQEERCVSANDEGEYFWMEVVFASDYNNKALAGFGNVALFVRESLIKYNFSSRKEGFQ